MANGIYKAVLGPSCFGMYVPIFVKIVLITLFVELDKKVKKLLVLTPDKFTEWMMQQSLVPNDQV